MCLTHTILDEPDISKPSSSGSSLTEMIVSLPTPPYRTGVLQNALLHCMPHNTSIASDAPTRKKTYPVGSMRALGSSRALAWVKRFKISIHGERHRAPRGVFVTYCQTIIPRRLTRARSKLEKLGNPAWG